MENNPFAAGALLLLALGACNLGLGRSDADGATTGLPGTEAGDGGGEGVPQVPMIPTRFVAIGDAGSGNDTQYAVADSVEAICAAKGCDFALYLGDNFYGDGVDDLDDDQFVEKFELPYANLSFPFYVVLGNHDYGGEGSGEDIERPEPQVEYARVNTQWKLPSRYYKQSQAGGQIDLFALDTNAIIWGWGQDQLAWANEAISGSAATWKIAFGHHPYYSNGPHGDAGSYDGQGWGGGFRDFMDEAVCEHVDVYFSGHDHSMQWLEPKCGKAELIISGTGSKTSDLEGDHPTHFEESTAGFMWVEIVGDTFTGEYYDEEGSLLYSRTFTKAG